MIDFLMKPPLVYILFKVTEEYEIVHKFVRLYRAWRDKIVWQGREAPQPHYLIK